MATRIGDGDIGSGLKYDGTQSRLRAATLLAAVGQRIGAVLDESLLAVPVSRSDIGAGGHRTTSLQEKLSRLCGFRIP